MTLFIQNSLTKKKEEFIPVVPDEVKMYTCGVTVYDDCHAGHARSLFIFDCLRKYLGYQGYKVTFVRNITDVDDKIINRAHEEGVSFETIRDRYINNYYRDLKALEIDKADFEPMATENIYYMVDHIKQLIAKGCAYEVEGDVYFSVRSFPNYGRLSGQSLDKMLTAVRIEKDEKKRDPLDFALWKKSKEGEPFWQSPWGNGRPGWHIECSTMSMRYSRTQTLDIHAGGRDLIFPHHENEIAQAESLTGQKFARYWIHHGLLTIDGKKMSKSLGNFITIQEALKKYTPNVLKLFFLSAHYSSPMDFTFDALQKTKRSYEKIEEFLDKITALRINASEDKLKMNRKDQKKVDHYRQEFERVMDDDFNTAQGLAILFDLLTLGNTYLASESAQGAAVYTCDVFMDLSRVLGLILKPSGKTRVIDAAVRVKAEVLAPEAVNLHEAEIKKLIEERRAARKRKDFKRADEIRDYLKAHGIIIEDMERSK